MINLNQNLYITYSNQKARDLKRQDILKPLDKIITLDNLILELFESSNFAIIIDEIIASSIIYSVIQNNKIEYFSYLNEESVSLNTIYNFIVKCKRNRILFDTLLSDAKLRAILQIDKAYQEYKEINNLVDIADIEEYVFNSWNNDSFSNYSEIYVDDFCIESPDYKLSMNPKENTEDYCSIKFVKSKYQREILGKFKVRMESINPFFSYTKPSLIKPSNEGVYGSGEPYT